MDNDTRWSSLLKMLEDLMQLKAFCEDYAVVDKKLHLSESAWSRIKDCIDALKPVKISTLTMQKE